MADRYSSTWSEVMSSSCSSRGNPITEKMVCSWSVRSVSVSLKP